MLLGLLTYVWQAQAQETVTPIWALGIALIAVVAAALTQAWIGSINQAKLMSQLEAKFSEKFSALERDIARLERVDDHQWKDLKRKSEQIAEIKERVVKVETTCEDRESC